MKCSSAQRAMARSGVYRVRPSAVSSYSTRGGTSPYTCRVTSPSRSRSPERLGEHLGADAVDAGAQVAEAQGADAERDHHHGRPLVGDAGERGTGRAGRRHHVEGRELWQRHMPSSVVSRRLVPVVSIGTRQADLHRGRRPAPGRCSPVPAFFTARRAVPHAFGARAVDGMGRSVDDPYDESSPYEIDRHGGARRARTDDQDFADLRVVHESSLRRERPRTGRSDRRRRGAVRRGPCGRIRE